MFENTNDDTTVYSLMIRVEEGNVIEIDREAEEVMIPSTATRICEVACFFGSITSLDLENTNVIIIEKYAFANCHKLKEVKFPSCLEEICKGAFKQCTILRHVSFPPESRLRIIGNCASKCCSMLENIEFPRKLEFIGDYCFEGCKKITIIDFRETKVRNVGLINDNCSDHLPPTVMPDDVIRISEECYKCRIEVEESHPFVQRDSFGYFFSNGTIFQGNKKSRRVLIRRGVERIARGCFNKSRIVSVTIPSSVTEISDHAFSWCGSLQHIRFTKDSQLRVIGEFAYFGCSSIKKIHFPKSLKIIKEGAIECCESLLRVAFPQDSQLERIEGAFGGTAISSLSLPPSVKEIVDVSYGMLKLESMFVSNDLFQSNEDGSAIFSKDGSELVCVITTLRDFKIPDSVRVIKKRAFYKSSIKGRLIIPSSVEIIEEKAFNDFFNLKIIDFEEGSRLNSLAFDAFYELESLIINNENFVKMGNGVVMSLNPRGIVFVPRELTYLEIPHDIEVIYSHAFYKLRIKSLKLPKSLKKICSNAFYYSSHDSVTFEEGTELDFIGNFAFCDSSIKTLKLPPIKGELEEDSINNGSVIEFPPNMCLRNKELNICAEKIVCTRSSLLSVACFNFYDQHPNLVVQNK